MAKKDKNKDLESHLTADEARIALDRVEAKLEELTSAVEKKLAEDKRGAQRAPLAKTNVKPVEMPSDIEVDIHDKYNTQPKNSSLHHYRKNYKMFRKDAMRNVMKSKMFWIILVVMPIIFTFMEFTFTGWGILNDFIFPTGLTKVTADLVNWFMLMPILLLSLTVFPTFIAMSRENNQLKRYTMKGMSRKQIYWAYMRFSVIFLLIFIFIWMGPWILVLNKAVDNIWLTPEQIAAGEHVFTNPWSIFFGMDFHSVNMIDSIDADKIALQWNAHLAEEAGTLTGLDYINRDDVLQFLIDNSTNITAITDKYFEMTGIQLSFKDEDTVLMVLSSLDSSSMDSNSGVITLSKRVAYIVPAYHEGVDTIPFFTLLILFTLGINSVGFNKAMKVSSSRSLMGWGIGLWIFASIVQGSTSLLYTDVYKFDSVDKEIWNAVVMVLLFILKWMFLFSPVTIMIVGISLTSGLIATPEMVTLPGWATQFMNEFANNPLWQDVPALSTINDVLGSVQVTDTLMSPNTTKWLFICISGLDASYWITKTWMFKSRIVSYEAAR